MWDPSEVFVASAEDLPSDSLLGGKFKRAAVRSDNALVVYSWISPDCRRVPAHQHDYDQIALIVSGAMRIAIGDEERLVKAGDVVRIPANVPHTGYAVGDEPVLNIDIFAPFRTDFQGTIANGAGEGEA